MEVGKRWFYSEIEKIAHLEIRQGFDTCKMRQDLGLKKSKQKLSNKFEAHCLDSWVLANWYICGHTCPNPLQPDNTQLIEVISLEFHRRQLHRLQHSIGHVRPRLAWNFKCGV
ncbi:hypothetical protein [Oscillatoria nigro-viridis]|uniref:hypothetical protein n=1 Tax=Phormidium nigroviride TaxID=482564 RepID=UPI0002F0AC3D|nr:hypothetical protein [Oscillatoria nigro-viridis]